MKKIVSDLLKIVSGPAKIYFEVQDGEKMRIVNSNQKDVKPDQHDIIIQIESITDLNI